MRARTITVILATFGILGSTFAPGIAPQAVGSLAAGTPPVWAAEFMAYNAQLTADQAVAQASEFGVIAATKGMYKPYVAQMKAANPNLVLLVYLNGTFAQKYEGTAYPESWYARDVNGNKIQSRGFGNYLMDVSKSGWIGDVVGRCTEFLAYSGYDGCFLNMLGVAPLNPNYVTGLPINPRTGVVWTKKDWLSATENIAGQVSAAIAPRPVFGNGLMFGSPYFSTDGATERILDGLQGAMSELFVRSPNSSVSFYRSEKQWLDDENMLVDAAARGDTVLTMTKVWTAATQTQMDAWHRFALATFLLGYTPRKAYFSFRYDHGSTFAHPY